VGGIGKSELAAQYAVRQGNKTVVHMMYTPGSNSETSDPIERSGLRQLLLKISISNFPLPPKSSIQLESNSEHIVPSPLNYIEERQIYYAQRLQTLRKICDDSVLLIVDNFNVANDEGLADLESLGCKIILTTWCNYAGNQYAQITLDNTEADEAWAIDLFCKQCPKAMHEINIVREIIQAVEYHTTAIILLGAQMQSDHISAKALRELLQNNIKNVGSSMFPFRKDGGVRTDEKIFGYLCAIFNISNLSPAEQTILLKMSFLPAQGTSRELFQLWDEYVDLNTINNLIRLRWIEEDPKTWNIRLSPVISEVVVATSGVNFTCCEDMLYHFYDWFEGLRTTERYAHLEMAEDVLGNILSFAYNFYSDSFRDWALPIVVQYHGVYMMRLKYDQATDRACRDLFEMKKMGYSNSVCEQCRPLALYIAFAEEWDGYPKRDLINLFEDILNIWNKLSIDTKMNFSSRIVQIGIKVVDVLIEDNDNVEAERLGWKVLDISEVSEEKHAAKKDADPGIYRRLSELLGIQNRRAVFRTNAGNYIILHNVDAMRSNRELVKILEIECRWNIHGIERFPLLHDETRCELRRLSRNGQQEVCVLTPAGGTAKDDLMLLTPKYGTQEYIAIEDEAIRRDILNAIF
jgi:hypothetical protein